MKQIAQAAAALVLFAASFFLPSAGAAASSAHRASAVPQASRLPLAAATESTLLYSGAGTNSRRIGTIKRGEPLPINARSKDNQWLRTTTGAWVAADSVENAPGILGVSETTYSRASTAEFQYLKEVIRWQLSFLSIALTVVGESPDGIVDMVSLIDDLEQWNQDTKAPASIADMGEWIGAVSMVCSSAAQLMSNSELWAGCSAAMTQGYIPQKFQERKAGLLPTPTPQPAAVRPTATPLAEGQGSYAQQTIDLFNRAGLQISGAVKTEADPNDVLPDTYVEQWEFVVAEVAPKGGQIFVCETKADCDVLFDYYSKLSALAGPNLFRSPHGLLVAQLNRGLSPQTAAKFETLINSLER